MLMSVINTVERLLILSIRNNLTISSTERNDYQVIYLYEFV